MENIQTAFTVHVEMFKNVLSNTKYYLKAQCAPRWNFAQKLCLLMIFSLCLQYFMLLHSTYCGYVSL